tara:strand:+ start:2920 stop:3543 length:624 start_codon:yes stop_codon:yes gene_type:complete
MAKNYINQQRRDLDSGSSMMSKMKNPPTNYGAHMYGNTTHGDEGPEFLGKIGKAIGGAVSNVASGVGNAVGGVLNAGKNIVGGVLGGAGRLMGGLLGGGQMPPQAAQAAAAAGGADAVAGAGGAGGDGQQVTIEGTMSTGGGSANFKPHFKGGFGAGMYKHGAAFNEGFKKLPKDVQAQIMSKKKKGSSMYKPGPGASMHFKKGGRV